MGKGQVEQVASLFQADTDSVSGSRQAINRKNEFVKPIYSTLIEAKAFVNGHTMDYPEKGIRLIKLAKVEWLRSKIAERQDELNCHLAVLDANWGSVKAEAKERLGELYNEADYPLRPSQAFGLELSFPAIKPDDRLLQLHPELYAAEQARIAARFDDAIKKAEAAAADELGGLLKRFIERLTAPEDGQRKVLKEGVVSSITDFAERFKALSIGSNAGLDDLVNQVEQLAQGIDIKQVRKADAGAKARLAEQLQGLTERIDQLVITRPVRELDID
jgi:hypothetical protein